MKDTYLYELFQLELMYNSVFLYLKFIQTLPHLYLDLLEQRLTLTLIKRNTSQACLCSEFTLQGES